MKFYTTLSLQIGSFKLHLKAIIVPDTWLNIEYNKTTIYKMSTKVKLSLSNYVLHVIKRFDHI